MITGSGGDAIAVAADVPVESADSAFAETCTSLRKADMSATDRSCCAYAPLDVSNRRGWAVSPTVLSGVLGTSGDG